MKLQKCMENLDLGTLHANHFQQRGKLLIDL